MMDLFSRRRRWRKRTPLPTQIGEDGPRRSDAERLKKLLQNLASHAAAVRANRLLVQPEPSDGVDETRLIELWRHWSMVMGPDLAPMARPLGRRHATLLVAGEDNFILQELSFQIPEILERVNAFMDAPSEAPLFTRVELSLLMGRRPLDRPAPIAITQPTRTILPPPPGLSPAALAGMDPDSPVTRCCAASLRAYGLIPPGK